MAIVIKFRLGYCNCGCGKSINIRSVAKRRLQIYKHGHSQKGSKHWKWKQGRILDKDGYVLIKRPFHPYKNARDYVQLHRLIIEAYYSIMYGEVIYLFPLLVIHHIDGNKQNNSLSNLEILTKRQHDSLTKVDHSKYSCIVCGSKKTHIDKQKRPRWYKYNDGFRCSYCYAKWYNKLVRERQKKSV